MEEGGEGRGGEGRRKRHRLGRERREVSKSCNLTIIPLSLMEELATTRQEYNHLMRNELYELRLKIQEMR